MTDMLPLPSLEALKAQAKRLRAGLDEDGDFITHAEALELIARQYGYRNWNTLHAAAGNEPPMARLGLGARVAGAYLGQAFEGEVIGIRKVAGDGWRVTIDFDEAVDVVTFDSFSAFRKRVSCVLDPNGASPAKTSNGAPHMRLRI